MSQPMTNNERIQLVALLSSTLETLNCEIEAQKVKGVEHAPVDTLVAQLSALERAPGLPTQAWKLIVQFKGLLGGKVDKSAFRRTCFEIEQLV